MVSAIEDIIEKIILQGKLTSSQLKAMKMHQYPNTPFNISDAINIVRAAHQIFEKENSIIEITTKSNDPDSQLIVVGDIHGNIDSLLRIFNARGYPPKVSYLFLGDYIDRGMFSCEVIVLLYSLKTLFPNNIFMIRGNHEFADMTEHYGFKYECLKRADLTFYSEVIDSFSALPLCAIINNKVFCVHGGISTKLTNSLVSRKSLMYLPKAEKTLSNPIISEPIMSQEISDLMKYEIEKNILFADLLWSDPSPDVLMFEKNQDRGIGSLFGEKAVDTFLKKFDFTLILRAHQNVNTGIDFPFDTNNTLDLPFSQKKLITVFSSLDYCGSMNEAGIVIIKNNENDENGNDIDFSVEIETFSLLPQKLEKNRRRRLLPEWIANREYEERKSFVKAPKLDILDSLIDLSVPILV